jgi:uncharacterized protein with beta-barrel porin domain
MAVLCSIIVLITAAAPAYADGGFGGSAGAGGGPGGLGFTGADGGNAGGGGFGGGGGGAAGGGDGGSGAGPAGQAGGRGAPAGAAGLPGSDNTSGLDGGGGGGGGGGNGNGAGMAGFFNAGALVGGAGGKGGQGGAGGANGGGGGGGGGGYGAIITSGTNSTNTGSILGGAGGGGGAGNGIGNGGSGGSGGVGVQFTASGATLTNTGIISGGAGGAAGPGGTGGAAGTGGAGGAGIVGAGITVINSGTIMGGLGGARANAITFTGGSNVLELHAGSIITGNVVGTGFDTLRLGGSVSSSFDLSSIGSAAQYRGFGNFAKAGSSTWTLTGTNAATQFWNVNAGTLAVNGTMTNTNITVNNGGTLAGTGMVGGIAPVVVNSGGTFAPGSGTASSTMSISGNLAFLPGGLYAVQVDPSSASSANVNGIAVLAGATVNAHFASGSYLTKQYLILTASVGLGGQFGGLANTNLPAGFTDSLSYSGNNVFLNLTAGLGAGGGLNQNQQSVANGSNNFFNSGGALPANFVNLFGLTGSALGNALTQLAGEAPTGAERSALQLTNEFLSLMLDPFVNGRANFGGGVGAIGFAPDEQTNLPPDVALAYASILNKAPPPPAFEQRWTAWGSAYGGASNANGNAAAGSSNVTASTFGFAGGMDYHLTPTTVVGFALAGAGTNWGLANALGTGRSDALQTGAYAISWLGPAYVAGALSFSNHWFTTNRTALGDGLTANFTGQSYGARLEGGYRIAALPILGVTPYGAVQFQDFRTPAYSETDPTVGGFGLSYTAMNATDVRTELGSRFDAPTLVYGRPLVLYGRVAWAHDFVANPALSAGFQALPGGTFTVNGAPIPQNSALTTAGAQLFLTPRWTLLAKFDGEFAGGSQTYAGSGTLRYSW